MNRLIGIGAVLVLLLGSRSAVAATVAVLPVEGELGATERAQVDQGLREALTGRAHTVVSRAEVDRALFHQGRAEDLEGLARLAATLEADYVLRVRVSPADGARFRLEMSAFRPSPPRVELLEQLVTAESAQTEIVGMLDQLMSVTPAAPEPARPPVAPEPPAEPAGVTAEEPVADEPVADEPEPSEPDEPEPGPAPPLAERPAYGSRPLEVGVYGGPTVLVNEPSPLSDRVGGRLGVGVGYSFLDWLGLGIRADLLFYLGNADAFGATVGSGIHYAPFRGIPLYVGLRLGLGVLQSASGARATFFLLRPEPILAYRIGQWVQIDLRPASFSLLFGDRTIAQYEALLGVSIMIGT